MVGQPELQDSLEGTGTHRFLRKEVVKGRCQLLKGLLAQVLRRRLRRGDLGRQWRYVNARLVDWLLPGLNLHILHRICHVLHACKALMSEDSGLVSGGKMAGAY